MTIDFGFDPQMSPQQMGEDALTFYRKACAALSPEFTALWFNDHFQFGDSEVLESWTTLTFLAAEFPRFKVGNIVLGQNYRNPALLAKMAATLQYLTGGRYLMGLGAGWAEEEYRAYGYEFPRPGARVQQLSETIQIVKALWTGGPVTFHGNYYHVEDAYCLPRPEPMIPILVGTAGRKALRVVAQYADAWNGDGRLEAYRQGYDLLRGYCEEIGRNFSEITLTAGVAASFPLDPSDFVADTPGQPRMLGPTPRHAIEQLRPLIDLGVSHFQVRMTDLPTVERFSAEVAPAFR